MSYAWASAWPPGPDLPEVTAFLTAPPITDGGPDLTAALLVAEARDQHRIDAAEDTREGRDW